MPLQGIETGRLGESIRKMLDDLPKGSDFTWVYDHGDRSMCPADVAEVKAFVGERVTNLNRLASVDFMLADRAGNVLLLAEVEERGVSPKKVLGDVMAILMCQGCAVLRCGSQVYFQIKPETELIVAGALPDAGDRLAKIRTVIQPRLTQTSGFPGGISPRNVSLLFDVELQRPLELIRQKVLSIVTGTKQLRSATVLADGMGDPDEDIPLSPEAEKLIDGWDRQFN